MCVCTLCELITRVYLCQTSLKCWFLFQCCTMPFTPSRPQLGLQKEHLWSQLCADNEFAACHGSTGKPFVQLLDKQFGAKDMRGTFAPTIYLAVVYRPKWKNHQAVMQQEQSQEMKPRKNTNNRTLWLKTNMLRTSKKQPSYFRNRAPIFSSQRWLTNEFPRKVKWIEDFAVFNFIRGVWGGYIYTVLTASFLFALGRGTSHPLPRTFGSSSALVWSERCGETILWWATYFLPWTLGHWGIQCH